MSRWTFHPSSLLTLKARYKPVFELYFWAGHLFFGTSTVAYHATSILIHIVNGWLVLTLASRLGMRRGFALTAAILFVVQPAYVAAVAWVGAVAEALVLLFGCASALSLVKFRDTGRRGWLAVSTIMFALALLSHESAVAFLPIIMLVDRLVTGRPWRISDPRVYSPFLAVGAIFIAMTLGANTGDYRRNEMAYSFGPHVVTHVFNYIIALYVDKPKLSSYLIVAGVMLLVAAFGSARARFALAWMVLAALPFAPFETGVLSRYSYVPAVGLALLIAEGLAALDMRLARRSPGTARAVVALLALFVALRFAHFARDGVKDSWIAAERYRTFLAELRLERPTMADGAVVYITPERDKVMGHQFVQAAVQWEYRNPTLRVEVR